VVHLGNDRKRDGEKNENKTPDFYLIDYLGYGEFLTKPRTFFFRPHFSVASVFFLLPFPVSPDFYLIDYLGYGEFLTKPTKT
jgi:hypothetical protein